MELQQDMDGKIHARLHQQSVDAISRRKSRPKTRRSALRVDGAPIWLKPSPVNYTHRLFSAAFRTQKNPPPRNCRFLLYFSRCIDSTILATLRSIGKNIPDGTECFATMTTYLLNLCANNRNPEVRYYASNNAAPEIGRASCSVV